MFLVIVLRAIAYIEVTSCQYITLFLNVEFFEFFEGDIFDSSDDYSASFDNRIDSLISNVKISFV